MKTQKSVLLACTLGIAVTASTAAFAQFSDNTAPARPDAQAVTPESGGRTTADANDTQPVWSTSGERRDTNGAGSDNSSGASGTAGSSASGGDEVRGSSNSTTGPGNGSTSDRSVSRTWDGIGSTGGGTGTGTSSGTTADPAPSPDSGGGRSSTNR